jgi:glutamate synthase (NADPH/NADH) small chain
VQVQDIATRGEIDEVPAQLVLIAKGFTGAERDTVDAFSPFENVRLAGDARLGATLVARAMADALQVAGEVADELLG